MARKILRELNYTFSPSTRTIVLPVYVPRERLVLITNVSTNQVIYNFSDTTLGASSYTALGGQQFPQDTLARSSGGQTTIVLAFNTASMTANDKLQFLIDEYEEKMMPAETYVDPANKFRVSTPQSMIDTDFELGLQLTKWEFTQYQNGAQSAFTRPTDTPLQPVFGGLGFGITNVSITGGSTSVTISGLTMSVAPTVGSYVYIIDAASTLGYSAFRYTVTAGTTSSVTFTVNPAPTTGTVPLVVIGSVPGTAANPSYAAFSVTNDIASSISVGTPVFIQDTFDEASSDGTFTVAAVSSSAKSFGFLPKATTSNTNVLQRPNTVIYVGSYYGAYAASSNIYLSALVSDGARIMTATTVSPHGLTAGSPIFILNSTQVNANGPWYVLQVPSATTFTYNTFNTVTAGSIFQVTTQCYLRPEGNQTHRPSDGGVQITPGNNIIGAQAIRQTRRYFRYQSGKGMQFSTAFTFKPNYDITSLSIAGQVCTITCDQDHGLKPGAIVRLTGLTATNVVDQSVYNSTFVVRADQPITAKTFAVNLSSSVTDTNPGGVVPTVEVVEAKGYAARAGLFDDQNGMFWEYDGTTLNVIRRSGTAILRGSLINVLTASNLVLGDRLTRFTKQLVPYDRIIIRGQTYTVMSILSDYQITINPPYRAATPSTASGTSGLPYSTLTSASSQIQTINISVNINASQISSAASSGGGISFYNLVNTFSRVANPTATGGGGAGTRSFTVNSAASIIPGMLVIGTNIRANTYVDTSYVTGSTTIPLTLTMLGSATGSYDFYTVPSPGMVISGTGIAAATDQQATTVASIAFTTTGGATTSGTVYVTQPMTAAASGTYTYGAITANTPTQVIALATTYGISPGMVLTGTAGGVIPGNCIVAFVQNQGSGVVLNAPITLTTTFTNNSAITFATATSLYAITAATTGSTTSAGVSSITMVSATALSGVQIGSYITTSTPAQYMPIGTYVTGINGAVITLNQVTTASIPASTNLVFGSRINVINSTNANINGTWPVASVSASTITFQTTASSGVTATVSTFGTTRIFGEDFVARKSIVRDRRMPQTEFNLDTLDGRGPSGFNLDLTKAQMIFMDYTWYGEGFARWGVRAVHGDVIYCHKLQHGNVQYQAYMRSGNLPGRFELSNLGNNPIITQNIANTGFTITPSNPGTITVFDASKNFVPFTDTVSGTGKNGEVLVENEYFFYTGLATTTGQAPWASGDNGVTSVATIGTVTVSGGSVITIPIVSGGSGYTSPPPIVISGPGAGARAVANVVGGSIVSIAVTNGGTGYSTVPNVYIGPNQLTGVVREPNAVTLTAISGTATTGQTSITSVANAASYYIGMRLGAISAFNNLPTTITGILGTTIFVDQVATTSGAITLTALAKGVATAQNHYAANTSGLPVATALNTNQQVTPAAQHWGVSVMMDGRFDNDKSYIFTTPRQTAAVVQPNATSPLVSIRVSPSVSLGFARNFGVRDIINRMQLNLYQMDVYTSGQFLITVRYNCSSNVFVPSLWTANLVGSGSLAQVIYHNSQDIVTGGDVVVAFYATNAGSGVFAVTQQDLSIVKDLGNSILGGDAVYPDGPDVITVFATNLSTTTASPIYSRLSWTEAQA